ncbi:lipopolysaccharide biosynthesis protein [Chryseobacterium camelliae]|uniref:lipopolysaccharide biosynthesis protein n=1 Tax=Chryseobacterium camelliae TaxID=1265445 RepID=UPI0028676251|nr:lipopolysaccharide biosynthesis protein [Chryseobacterium camelliae]MDR6516353.1 O-antigen/teichoic acid export membrane protein [Chryseobacterium camelliae]
MSFKNNVLTGAVWTYGQQFGTQIVQFGVSVILARLIAPSDFGLIGMIAIFIGLGNALFEGGLTNSLIRSSSLNDDDYSTVFIFNIVVSIFVYIIIYLIAPIIADFYNQSILKNIIRIYSLSFIINSFGAVHNTLLVKEMQFKKIALIAFPSLIIYSITAIYMAFNDFGVWSLVFSFLLSSLISTMSLWYFNKWKPKLIFDRKKFKVHFKYGNKLMLSSILDILFTNIYQIVIGKIYSPTLLGYYTRANTLMMLPVVNISTTLNKVAFPAFSQMQNNEELLRSAYRRIMLLVIYLTTPVLTIMIVLANPLIEFLLTEKWLPIVPIFQILCITGIFYPLHVYNLLILQVKGKSNLFLYLELIKKILTALILVISIQQGFYGLLWGQVLLSILCLFINTHFAGKYLNYTMFQQLKDLLPLFVISVIMGIVIYFTNNYVLSSFSNLSILVLGTSIGVVFYIIVSAILKLSTFQETIKIIKKI